MNKDELKVMFDITIGIIRENDGYSTLFTICDKRNIDVDIDYYRAENLIGEVVLLDIPVYGLSNTTELAILKTCDVELFISWVTDRIDPGNYNYAARALNDEIILAHKFRAEND